MMLREKHLGETNKAIFSRDYYELLVKSTIVLQGSVILIKEKVV